MVTPYVAPVSERVQLAQKNIAEHLKRHGRSSPKDLFAEVRRSAHVQEWEVREAMSRLMSKGDVRISNDWTVEWTS